MAGVGRRGNIPSAGPAKVMLPPVCGAGLRRAPWPAAKFPSKVADFPAGKPEGSQVGKRESPIPLESRGSSRSGCLRWSPSGSADPQERKSPEEKLTLQGGGCQVAKGEAPFNSPETA